MRTTREKYFTIICIIVFYCIIFYLINKYSIINPISIFIAIFFAVANIYIYLKRKLKFSGFILKHKFAVKFMVIFPWMYLMREISEVSFKVQPYIMLIISILYFPLVIFDNSEIKKIKTKDSDNV